MNPMVTVRDVGLDELETLMAWRMKVLHDVFSIDADTDTSALESANREYYRHSLAHAGHIACFALVDDEIIGCGGVCLQQEMPSPDNPNGLCGYLMNIYVEPRCRQAGIGEQIVDWLIRQARKRNATKIYLEASEKGRALYEQMGFKTMADYMKL
jgi:GNAT superfamily N-acetyltransferase